MLFYKAKLKAEETKFNGYKYKDGEDIPLHYVKGEVCKFFGLSKYNAISSIWVSEEKGLMREVAFACNRVDYGLIDIMGKVEVLLKEMTGFDYSVKEPKEINAEAYTMRFGRLQRESLELNYFNTATESYIADSRMDCSLNNRDKLCLLANEDLQKELQRINSPMNKKTFVGNITHYILKTDDRDNAQEMLDVLLGSLYANNRLVSKRITKVVLKKYSYDFEGDLEKILRNSSGSTTVFEFTEENSKTLFRSLNRPLANYAMDTLFVFIINENTEALKQFCNKNQLRVTMLEDGVASKEKALTYVCDKLSKTPIGKYFDDNITEEYLSDQEKYSYRDLNLAYLKCYDDIMAKDFYRAYGKQADREVSVPNTEELYEELHSLIGLKSVKEMVLRIINFAKYAEYRKKLKIASAKPTLHMCFKGNPGTAKTTIARLLGKLLQAEGVLANGCFVECGRADLVGQYVGWTAKIVKSKFEAAKGGILFIDEAYSLVEDRNSFGAEAINTIVQEMENHRDDVLVIFAGYPEKMEQFLNMNEGLRSRIPFHLAFQDYSGEELYEILLMMMAKQGYRLEDGRQSLLDFFNKISVKDNLGNGRYVRNFLEQAILLHAERVMAQGEFSEENFTTLNLEDFNLAEENVTQPVKLGLALT